MTVRLTKHDFAWTGETPRRVFQHDVRGYPQGEGAGIAQLPHENWRIIRWNTTVQTEWLGDFPTPDDALATLQTWFEQGDSSLITRNKLEGSLDIIWTNHDRPTEIPSYHVLFLRYRGLKGGGQGRKEILGKEALKSYLRQFGIDLLRIYAIINEVESRLAVSLPNVHMSEYEYRTTYQN